MNISHTFFRGGGARENRERGHSGGMEEGHSRGMEAGRKTGRETTIKTGDRECKKKDWKIDRRLARGGKRHHFRYKKNTVQ